jgi:subtilisin family serine protease
VTATPIVEESVVEMPEEDAPGDGNAPPSAPEAPPTVAETPPEAPEFDFDDPETFDDPDQPEYYENAKVSRSVIEASVTRSPGDEPYPNVAVKLGSEPQVLPVAEDVPPTLLASANYLAEVSGDYTLDDGETVPIGFTTTEDNPPVAIGFDDGDPPDIGTLTDEEFDKKLEEAGRKPGGPGAAPAAKEPIIIAPIGITVERGPLDTKATGLDQVLRGGATSGGGVVRSEPQRSEPKVPEGLKTDAKTEGLRTTVRPEPPRLTQPVLPGAVTKAQYHSYYAEKDGLRIQTVVSVTHIPGDTRLANNRDCRIIVRASRSKVRWKSGGKSGEFLHSGGARVFTHPFKGRQSASPSFTLTDLDISFKELAEQLKAGLPDGAVAGSASFELTIVRAYEIIIACTNPDGQEVRYVIERGTYERKLEGRLIEKRNPDAATGESDRTGEYEFNDLGAPAPSAATGPRTVAGDKAVKRSVPSKKPAKKKLAFKRAAPAATSFAIIQEEGEPPLEEPIAGVMCVSNRFMIGQTPVTIVKVDDAQREQFIGEASTREGVETVEIDPCRKKEVPSNDPYFTGTGLWGQDFEDQWAIRRVGFDEEPDSALALPGEDLEPVTVAVIDTGVDWFHPDFSAARFWTNEAERVGIRGDDDDGNGFADDVIGWNFIDGNNLPWDKDGHGTFVAGVIAAESDNFVGISGINPAARIMVLKALDAFGQGHASMAAQAIVYAADNGARVINLSLGGETPTAMEALAIDHARARGAVVVVAAGNSGEPVERFAPAGLPGVITVAASDRRDLRASFSNWGPMVDIAAPGVDVLSLRARQTDLLSLIREVDYLRGNAVTGDDRAYYRASGTSFAAPIVAGVASLVMARRPELSGEQVARMILHSARDIETPGVDNFTGYGLLDAKAALRADPDFFVEARIEQVRGVQAQGKPALRIIGTIDADRMGKANVFLGQGADPEDWRRVQIDLKERRRSAPLVDLPASLFSGARTWTIRLVTTHEGGMTRESRLTLNLE